MTKFVCLLLWLMSGASEIALASGADIRLSPAPVNRLDEESLQRGARNFVNYCLSCHTAKYMRKAFEKSICAEGLIDWPIE